MKDIEELFNTLNKIKKNTDDIKSILGNIHNLILKNNRLTDIIYQNTDKIDKVLFEEENEIVKGKIAG